jgi:hypothetical protein
VTHCHINNLDMCKKFRIFVGWEGGVICFGQVDGSLTKCHELGSQGTASNKSREYVYRGE